MKQTNVKIDLTQHAELVKIKQRTGIPVAAQIRKALEYYIGTFPADECGHDEAQRKGGQTL